MLGPGEKFAKRYEVVAHVGAGGMGDVYAARDAELGDVIALKLLSAQRLAESAAWLDRFRDEVRLARKVTHRNVARIYDIGAAGDDHYLTMELVEGESLRKRMRAPPALTMADAVRVASELAAGLTAAHAAGVVHGDFKPGNAILERDTARAVLIDFGLAKSVDAGRDIDDIVVGTPSYMAPEQLRGEPLTAAADVYAFGLVLFELVARERPFTGKSGIDRAMARMKLDAPDVRSFRAATPAALADVIAACLARDPQRRPSMREVGARLAAAHTVVAAAASTHGDADDADDATQLDAVIDESTHVAAPAPAAARAYRLAVLPFSADDASSGLADGLTDALRELLALTDGLVVVPTEAAKSAVEQRLTGRRAGLALDVDALIEGAVHGSAGGGTEIDVRLVEVETGKELHRDALRGRVGDLLRAQDAAARRIAEALRVTITTDVYRHAVDDETVERYLRARPLCRIGPHADPLAAYREMDLCAQKTPTFHLAHAARAIAATRLAFVPFDAKGGWMRKAEEAVAAAVAAAAEVPDTHLAASMLAVQRGSYGDAIAALERALRLAPSFAEAHEQLGRLEIESGRVRDGCRRLFLASDLDARCGNSLSLVVRAAWYRGNAALAARAARRIAALPVFSLEHGLLQLRTRLYDHDVAHGDVESVRRALPGITLEPARTLLEAALRAVDGDPEPLAAFAGAIDGVAPHARYRVLQHQVCAEAFGRRDPERALLHVEQAGAAGLFDLEWLEKCPALTSVRADPRFAHVRDAVARRVLRI